MTIMNKGFDLNSQPIDSVLTTKDLINLDKNRKKLKRRSGYILLTIVIIIHMGLNILNFLYMQDSGLFLWSTLITLVFLISIFLVKFDFAQRLMDAYFPFLQEPDDFLKSNSS